MTWNFALSNKYHLYDIIDLLLYKTKIPGHFRST